MQLAFNKMHGLGNDVIVIDALDQSFEPNQGVLRWLADRRLGVGCDQIMLIEPATLHGCDFAYRVFNADGSSAEQCGNGVRCVARYLIDQRQADSQMTLQSPAGPIVAELVEGAVADPEQELIRVEMGPPVLNPPQIPFEATERAYSYALSLGQVGVEIGAVSMGNPHAVLRVEDISKAPVEELGPAIGRHPRFPEQTNVEFLQQLDKSRARLRVFERGVGETAACGSGACAAMVIGRLWKLFDDRVSMELPGGELTIEWAGEGHPVWMTGPAEYAFQGTVQL